MATKYVSKADLEMLGFPDAGKIVVRADGSAFYSPPLAVVLGEAITKGMAEGIEEPRVKSRVDDRGVIHTEITAHVASHGGQASPEEVAAVQRGLDGKPRKLAAGQVWEIACPSIVRYTLIQEHSTPGYWIAEVGGGDAILYEDRFKGDGARYPGTREGVAAASESDADLRWRCGGSEAAQAIRDALRAGATLRPAEEIAERVGLAPLAAAPAPVPTPPPWTMADCRREIDRVLAAEERRGMPFVRAIGAALRGEVEEGRPLAATQIRGVVAALVAYEEKRGGMRSETARRLPGPEALRFFNEPHCAALVAYRENTELERVDPRTFVDYLPDAAIMRYERERGR